MGEVAGDGVGIWFVEVTNKVGIVGLEIRRGNVGMMPDVDFLGPRIKLMFPRNTNGFVNVEVGRVFVGVLVVIVGVFVGICGVGIGVMTGGGFIIVPPGPIDRRARPSSGSTEIDAFLLDRRPVARRWLCSLCGFIVFFPPDVTVSNQKPT